jgi:hypothetical protein
MTKLFPIGTLISSDIGNGTRQTTEEEEGEVGGSKYNQVEFHVWLSCVVK